MKKNDKLVMTGAAVLAALLIVFGVIWSLTRPATSPGSKSITVEVIHQDESKKTFTYKTDAEYLADLLVGEGLVVDNQDQYGLLIQEVDGERAVYEENQSYWSILQNGEYAQMGASTLPIYDGDTISLVYTVYSGG